MRRFTKDQFRQMPWKNGKGFTTELYRRPLTGEKFDLRISIAKVDNDGPFSLFPSIKRVILILDGNGCSLVFADKTIVLTKDSEAFSFSGEDNIHCCLQDGSLTDFNVMFNPQWGNISVKKNKLPNSNEWDHLFVYDIHQQALVLLDKNEVLEKMPVDYISIEIKSNDPLFALN